MKTVIKLNVIRACIQSDITSYEALRDNETEDKAKGVFSDKISQLVSEFDIISSAIQKLNRLNG